MKKLLSITLTLVLMLSLSVPAFAMVNVQGGTSQGQDSDGTYIYDSNNDSLVKEVEVESDKLKINGPVVNDTSGSAVSASDSAKVTVTDVVFDCNHGDAINASDLNTTVTVKGNVEEYDEGNAINAKGGAKVEIDKDVTESGTGDAIKATGAETTVKVHGKVTEEDKDYAINAQGGATVEIDKDVTESGDGIAIFATGDNTTVTVKGDVTEDDEGAAIDAQKGATVIVKGSVTEKNGGAAITADASTVIVGGNVTETKEEGGTEITIFLKNGAEVIVEGEVKVESPIGVTDGALYLGQLDAEKIGGADKIHYLIGTTDDGAQLTDITFGGNVGDDTIEGVDKGSGAKSYRYTSTGDTSKGLTITLKASNGGKQLKDYDGALPEGVEKSYNNGVLTLTLNSAFKGGLQNLQLLLEDIVRKTTSDDDSYKPIFTGSKGNPVTNGKWRRNADGTWTYATVYQFSNTWGYIANPNVANSAAWYYFDRNGNMLTGWQKLYWNGVQKWYYFSQTKDSNEGKCLVDCITPDGYKVGPDGAWIED